MGTAIRGLGWVTPLGTGLEEVWTRLLAGDSATPQNLSHPASSHTFPYFPVPPKLVESAGRNPRLRRSSAISYFTATAGLQALADAGITVTPELAERIAVIFAISSGGVVYTRRFYDTIVKEGASVASPLLFPETVYNAPASHLAALLGLTGMSYTLVGDATVGLAALKYAEQLLDTSQSLECCLVIGGEEVDWVLCEAYAEWRLIAGQARMEVYASRPAGTVLGEGAAAIVVGREGPVSLERIHAGAPFFRRADAPAAAERVVAELVRDAGSIDLVVGSANGTFVDAAEFDAVRRFLPTTPIYCPKPALGEALGAGSLMQTVCAALALRTGAAPPTFGQARVERPIHLSDSRRSALVTSVGFNLQASGALVTAGTGEPMKSQGVSAITY